MSCEATEPLLALHVDDALTPTESQQVEAHLKSCQDCQSLLVELRGNRSLLRSLPLVPPSGYFRESLLRMLTSQNKRKKSAIKYLLPRLGSLAAALLVVLLASNLYLFPMFQPTSLVGDYDPMSTTLLPPRFNAATKGVPEQRSTDQAQGSIVASLAEADAPDYWFWSSLGALGLFGLGSGYFVHRYRHIWLS